MAGALLLLLLWAAPAVCADQTVLRDQSYQMSGKSIIVHIISVNVVDKPMSNIMPQPDMKYYQIIYNYSNTGNTEDKGFIQPIFIDASGGQYRYMDYTSTSIQPGRTSDNNFIEMPVPKNTIITKIIFIEGLNEPHPFNLMYSSPTPTIMVSGVPTPVSSPTSSGFNWRECLPLIPFAMAGGIAGVGIVINRCGIRKR
jgi:hypothetical protein